MIELKVADDLGNAHLGEHGLPSDDALTDAHVVDKLVWVGHELLVIAHHERDRTGNNHGYQTE